MKTENVDCEKKTLQRQQFLINLQLEYLTHKLRSIIYQDETYAKVSLEISEKKKQKIIELGEKFNLKTLFDSSYNSDRKSTRLNSSHVAISYAVFCLKKKKNRKKRTKYTYKRIYRT